MGKYCITSYLYELHRIANHIETESKIELTGAQGLGEGNGTHSGTLAWKIPWTEEPGGLQSMGSPRVGHD